MTDAIQTTLPIPNTPAERAAAVRMAARLAHDGDDLALLLDVLGIDATTPTTKGRP